jgi:hypothetical protein
MKMESVCSSETLLNIYMAVNMGSSARVFSMSGAASFPEEGVGPENVFTNLHLSSFRVYLPTALEN